MLKWFGAFIVLGAVAAAATFWFACPCTRIPGGPLTGEVAPSPVPDWSFVNDAGLCQVEVDRGIPWSINLNCMSSGGALYISCSQCAGKGWSQAALVNPHGFIRVRETLYPVRLSRLTEAAKLDVAWQARAEKLKLKAGTARPDHWWSFQLQSR